MTGMAAGERIRPPTKSMFQPRRDVGYNRAPGLDPDRLTEDTTVGYGGPGRNGDDFDDDFDDDDFDDYADTATVRIECGGLADPAHAIPVVNRFKALPGVLEVQPDLANRMVELAVTSAEEIWDTIARDPTIAPKRIE